mgnify:FL=1
MTTTAPNLDTILERVRKLLALSTSSNPAEAAAAAAKAQALLLEYNLSMDQIGEAKTASRTTHHTFLEPRPKNEGKWRAALIAGVGRCHFCKVIDANPNFILIGQKEDMEVTREVYAWLVGQILHLGPETYKTAVTTARKPTYLRSFYYGAATTICQRLNLEWTKLTGQRDDSMALVVRRAEQAQSYMDENFRTKSAPKARFSSIAGYRAGAEAGKAINIDGRGRKLEAGPKSLAGG